jgi:hypothetical protein
MRARMIWYSGRACPIGELPPVSRCDAVDGQPNQSNGSSEESDVPLDESLVNRSTFRIELVAKLYEQTVPAPPFELGADGRVDLRRKALLFPLELRNQILVKGDGYLSLGQVHTCSVPK